MGETVASGGLQFFLENRTVVDDGGPSLQVLAEVEQQMVQLLRFDMFYKQPHYHYAPNGQNIRYNLDPLALDDGIGWVMSLLRSKLPQLVAKAGQDGLLTSEGNAAVIASLPLIEARWRAQEPARVVNASSLVDSGAEHSLEQRPSAPLTAAPPCHAGKTPERVEGP